MFKFNSEKALKITAYIISTLFILLIVFPLIYIASLSLQDDSTIYSYPPYIIPPPAKSIEIVIDYSKYGDKSKEELEDMLLKDTSIAMYSTVYELNKEVIGEIKVYGTMDGKTIYYSRAHGMMIKLQMQFGALKQQGIIMQNLTNRNNYLKSAKDIGYTFDYNGVENTFDTDKLGKNDLNNTIADNFGKTYKLSGDFINTAVTSNYSLLLENYIYYFKMPQYMYSNFENIKNFGFFAFMFNTIITFVWAVICQVVLCSITAYPISKLLKKRVADGVLLFFLITMMIPFVSIMVPQMILVKNLGMANTYRGMLLPWLLPYPFYIFLFKGFFDKIPSAFFDAARIDGSSEINTFIKICMPMSKSIITLIALQSFISGWGDFMWYFLIANRPNLWTLNVALYTIGSNAGAAVRQNFIMGLSLLTIIPVLLVTALFSKQIKESVMSSGLKG